MRMQRRARRGARVDPAVGGAHDYRGLRGIVGIGAIDGGFAWRASRTPHRTDLFLDVRVPPTLPMARARAEVLDFVRSLRERSRSTGSSRRST